MERAFRKFFFSPFSFSEYTARLGYLGEEISLTVGEKTERAILLGVSEQGLLQVERNGERREYSAGEVTVRR